MKIKEIFKLLPSFPLSALIFYIIVFLLWNVGVLPHPLEIVRVLEGIYEQYGIVGLFISTLLEGIAYVGLYFPGTTIILVSAILCKGNFLAIIKIALAITLALSLISIFNYWFGKIFLLKKSMRNLNPNGFEKNILFSILHPNLLSFYFFYRGFSKKNFWKVIYVPVLVFPYAFIGIYIISIFSEFVKNDILGNPFVTLSLIFLWFIVSFIVKNKEEFFRGCKRIYKYVFS